MQMNYTSFVPEMNFFDELLLVLEIAGIFSRLTKFEGQRFILYAYPMRLAGRLI